MENLKLARRPNRRNASPCAPKTWKLWRMGGGDDVGTLTLDMQCLVRCTCRMSRLWYALSTFSHQKKPRRLQRDLALPCLCCALALDQVGCHRTVTKWLTDSIVDVLHQSIAPSCQVSAGRPSNACERASALSCSGLEPIGQASRKKKRCRWGTGRTAES